MNFENSDNSLGRLFEKNKKQNKTKNKKKTKTKKKQYTLLEMVENGKNGAFLIDLFINNISIPLFIHFYFSHPCQTSMMEPFCKYS